MPNFDMVGGLPGTWLPGGSYGARRVTKVFSAVNLLSDMQWDTALWFVPGNRLPIEPRVECLTGQAQRAPQ